MVTCAQTDYYPKQNEAEETTGCRYAQPETNGGKVQRTQITPCTGWSEKLPEAVVVELQNQELKAKNLKNCDDCT